MPSATASPEEDDTPTVSRTEEELSKSGEPGRRTCVLCEVGLWHGGAMVNSDVPLLTLPQAVIQ